MSEAAFSSESILAVDFGTASTRVILFDVVEGVYRFVAAGEAPSTLELPYRDAQEGMRHALRILQDITGRIFINDDAKLIIPSTPEGTGVDAFVATASGGEPARAVLVGLLPDVSMEAARRLAESSYVQVMDTFSLGDHRREEQQVDAMVKAKPNIILMAGGTDGGASHALLNLADMIGLGCFLVPANRAHLLYMGNASLKDKIAEKLGSLVTIHSAPNVMPKLGDNVITPARAELARIFDELRMASIGGFGEISQWAGGRVQPTAQAEGQVARFLNQIPDGRRGVLSVDVGSASSVIAAAFGGDLHLNVFPTLGQGQNATGVLADTALAQIKRWVPFEISDADLRDFVYTKAAYPHTVPYDARDLYLECALARMVLRTALHRARPNWPLHLPGPRSDLLPWVDIVLGGGGVIGKAPTPGTAALLLLDALQPVGVTRLLADPYHLAAALGAGAYVHPLAMAQVYETGGFLDLGPSISILGRARLGNVVCTGKLAPEGGTEVSFEVKYGSLDVLRLPVGQKAKLTLKPRGGFDVGFGAGRSQTINVMGGMVGVIFDARGRSLLLPENPQKRFELLTKWNTSIGGVTANLP